jgi:anthranilate synthase component 1
LIEREEKETTFSVLASFLPAGTLSGAPKIRAMEIIDELEKVRRGIYGGAVGYFSFDGNMDTCIAIRTMVIKDEKIYMQAGAGLTINSVPELEYEECLNKVKVLIEALGGSYDTLNR